MKRIRRGLDRRYFTSRTFIDDKGCWIWIQGVLNNGYGACQGGTAHKKAYETMVGEVPTGRVVRHSCDTKLCCNPDHLRIGTQSDNYYDIPEDKRKELHIKSGKTFKRLGYGKNLDGSALSHGIYRLKFKPR